MSELKKDEYSLKPSKQRVSERSFQGRIYSLLKLSLPKYSKGRRKKALDALLNEKGTVGIIEWWTRGSIVNKPGREFQVILIAEA